MVWTRQTGPRRDYDTVPGSLWSASRSRTGPFRPAEVVWDGPVGFGTSVDLLLDPASGRPEAVWPSVADDGTRALIYAREDP
jgi:hypothetical protein